MLSDTKVNYYGISPSVSPVLLILKVNCTSLNISQHPEKLWIDFSENTGTSSKLPTNSIATKKTG